MKIFKRRQIPKLASEASSGSSNGPELCSGRFWARPSVWAWGCGRGGQSPVGDGGASDTLSGFMERLCYKCFHSSLYVSAMNGALRWTEEGRSLYLCPFKGERKKELCFEVRLCHCPVLSVPGKKKQLLLGGDIFKLTWSTST